MNDKILPIITIVGNVQMAKALSEKFASEKHYFAIMEEPWVSRPDAEHEVMKRNNLLAVTPHKCLIIAGCSDRTVSLMMKQFPEGYQKKVIIVKTIGEIETALSSLSCHFNKKEVNLLSCNDGDIKNLSTEQKIGVIEKSECIGEIIAENFCLAHGYKILKIESVSRETTDACENLLRDWNCSENGLVREDCKVKLFAMLRGRVGKLEHGIYNRIVFFTRGMPYGVLPFKSPVAHLFLERDLGLQILRGYFRICGSGRGTAIALICDPGEFVENECEKIKSILAEKRVEIIDLGGELATCHRFKHLIERYPYDLAVISSHAGEVSGKKIKGEFVSKKGNKYCVEYMSYASFAPTPGDDMISVTELTVPLYVNGIPWSDAKRKEEDEQVKEFDLNEFTNKDRNNFKPISTEDCGGIKFSQALKMNDFSWIVVLQIAGETRYPIIFNNACSSWIEMAGKFIFAEASVYIGTTKDINTSLASSCGSRFFELCIKRDSMLYALFQTQQKYAIELGYTPYLYWGHPDMTLKPILSNANKIMKRRAEMAKMSWSRRLLNAKDDDMKRSIRAILKCITEVG